MATTTDSTGDRRLGLDILFSCLANSDRRQLLRILYERAPDSLTRRDLATCFIPGSHENPEDLEPSEAVQQVLLTLHHTHLPKLEAAGLIDQDSDRGTVTITDHPAFEDSGIVHSISDEMNADTDFLDTLFVVLTESRRRTILDVLSHQFGLIHMETLAREIGDGAILRLAKQSNIQKIAWLSSQSQTYTISQEIP